MENSYFREVKAFSLIELSIVILIIGILIAGVTQSSRMLKESKLNTARTLTQSSPVSGINGLSLWIESTMENSFSYSESEDGSQLSTWTDLNPQTTSKFFVIKTASSDVTYQRNGINGLPSVKFSGSTGANTFFTLSRTSDVSDATVVSDYQNAYTFFIVSQLDSSVDLSDLVARVAFYNGNTSSNGWGYLRNGSAPNTGKRSVLFGGVINNFVPGEMSTSTQEIASGTYVGGNNVAIKFYLNGVAQTLDADTGTSNTPTGALYIGNSGGLGNEPWKGLISEIIIFNKVLKNSDRIEIERYLGKKYGITVQ